MIPILIAAALATQRPDPAIPPDVATPSSVLECSTDDETFWSARSDDECYFEDAPRGTLYAPFFIIRRKPSP